MSAQVQDRVPIRDAYDVGICRRRASHVATQMGFSDVAVGEVAVLATELARRIKPDIYIVARTTYTSAGLKAAQLGANEVIKGEQEVARQFYEKLVRRLGGMSGK